MDLGYAASETFFQRQDEVEEVHGIEFDLIAEGAIRVQADAIHLRCDSGKGGEDEVGERRVRGLGQF
jgi:hypothetical protein